MISGLTLDTSYTVTSGNTDCTSAASASFSNASKLVQPAVPILIITQPKCGKLGKIKISNYDAAKEYSIDGGAYATISVDTFDATLGTHTVQAKDTMSNCLSTLITSEAINNALCATNDTLGSPSTPLASGASPVSVGSVITNDTLNGVAVTSNNTNVTPIRTGNILVDVDGNVTIAANTPTGSYSVVYTICESLDAVDGANVSPSNCTTATLTVNVVGEIVARGDEFPIQIPSTTVRTSVGSVIVNNGNGADTLNGIPGNSINTIVTVTTLGPLSIDAQGILTLAPNTPAGTYLIPYTICEKDVIPSNCSTATATVIVGFSKLEARDNIYSTPISGVIGGYTGINVFSNDLHNGAILDPSKVSLTPVAKGPLSVASDGRVFIAANTPAGLYSINYTICEIINPTNCSTALVSVIVQELPSIAIVKTAVFNDINGDGYAQAGETITYSFEITNTGNVNLSSVTVTDNLQGLVLSGSPIAVLGIGEVNTTAYTGLYKLTQADINFGSVSNQAIVEGTSLNNVVVSDLSDELSKTGDQATVLGIQGCVIEVFNAVAPYGNGDNKVFRIRGLECYTDNKVEIYNRWGILVFERSAYNNNDRAFRGRSEGRVTLNQSEELPEGTYYYILRYKDSASVFQQQAGYLYINR